MNPRIIRIRPEQAYGSPIATLSPGETPINNRTLRLIKASGYAQDGDIIVLVSVEHGVLRADTLGTIKNVPAVEEPMALQGGMELKDGSGLSVRILTTTMKRGDNHKVAALITGTDGVEFVRYYTVEGKYSEGFSSGMDLIIPTRTVPGGLKFVAVDA